MLTYSGSGVQSFSTTDAGSDTLASSGSPSGSLTLGDNSSDTCYQTDNPESSSESGTYPSYIFPYPAPDDWGFTDADETGLLFGLERLATATVPYARREL